MVGGNGIVDGFRRLFHRRTPSGSVPGSSNQSSAGEDVSSSDIEAVEDLDLVGLRAIRVPKRKMPLPVETHKKVRPSPRRLLCSRYVPCLLARRPVLGCRSFLVIPDSSSREILSQDRIFAAVA
jgi:hypothetical protein